MAIQAKKCYVLPNGKITTGETGKDIHLMDFNREIRQDENFLHEKLVRALLIFDSFHLLTMEMFGDEIGFWSLGKVNPI